MERSRIGISLAAIGCVAVLAAFFGATVGAGGAYLALRSVAAPAAVESVEDGASAAALPLVPAPTPVPAEPAMPVAPAAPGSVALAVERVGPAVVTIVNHLAPSFGPAGQDSATATGSGVIISPDGYIVTNHHVIDGADSLEAIFADGTRVPATLVGSDPFADIAVVQVDGPVPAVAEWGDSDLLSPGDSVVAIGSALGDFANTVTAGVVSATHRSLEASAGYRIEDLIQTDAAINHGNSGGPLANLEGRIVGINTLVVRGNGVGAVAEGLGFAIESSRAQAVAKAIIRDGVYPRPYLGVQWEWLTPDLMGSNPTGEVYAARLTTVVAGGPAADAGLRSGDLLTGIDGIRFSQDNLFLNLLLSHQPGDTVAFDVIRNGARQSLSVTLGKRPAA